MKIALAQICCPKGDWPANLTAADYYMAAARREGCSIVVFPEMGLSGYCDPTLFPQSVQRADSPLVQHFLDLTARHHIAASGGFIEQNPNGKPFITQIVAQNGSVLAVYRKRYLGEDESEWFAPGSETVVFNLRVGDSLIPCSVAVCADSESPDLFKEAAERGAKIVFHSSAPGLYGRRTDAASWQEGYNWYKGFLADQLPHYAREYNLFIAVATQTGSTVDEDFPGGSFVFAPDGSYLASTEDYRETLLIADMSLPPAP